jgi:hypothetical protein
MHLYDKAMGGNEGRGFPNEFWLHLKIPTVTFDSTSKII